MKTCVRLTKWDDLRCYHAADALYTAMSVSMRVRYLLAMVLTYPLSINPVKEIGKPCPPARPFAVDSRVAQMQEESQTPALRDVVRFGIDLRQSVCQVRFGRDDTLRDNLVSISIHVWPAVW